MLSYHKQPLRTLYLVYEALSTLCVRVPLWVLISILPQLRPRPSWTIRRCVTVRLTEHMVHVDFR